MDWQLAVLHGAMIFALYEAGKAAGRTGQNGRTQQRRQGTAALKRRTAEPKQTDRVGRALDNLTAYDGTDARQEEMEDVHEQWNE